jgi:hypothetical protein
MRPLRVLSSLHRTVSPTNVSAPHVSTLVTVLIVTNSVAIVANNNLPLN